MSTFTAASTSISNESTGNTTREWTVKKIRNSVQEFFGKRPCWYQFEVKTALALYAGKDVIGCA